MKTIKLFLLFVGISCFAQNSEEKNQVKCTRHEVISAKMNFEEDLKNNKITIYLQGGIVSVIKNSDLDFEKDYSVKYKDFGCMVPENITFYETYNRLVYNYLLEKFGKTCISKMNSNAFGFRKWTTQT